MEEVARGAVVGNGVGGKVPGMEMNASRSQLSDPTS